MNLLCDIDDPERLNPAYKKVSATQCLRPIISIFTPLGYNLTHHLYPRTTHTSNAHRFIWVHLLKTLLITDLETHTNDAWYVIYYGSFFHGKFIYYGSKSNTTGKFNHNF